MEGHPAEFGNIGKDRKILYIATGSTLVFIIYSMVFLEPAGKCFRLDEGSNSLGLSFSYTLEMVQNFFDLRNQEQLDCYSEFLRIWDILFAIIYTTMYSSWMMFFIEKKRKLLAFPILAMVADWSENLVEVMMINKYTQGEAISETTVMIGSSLNSLKWILQSITFTILLVGIISKSFLKIKAMKNDSEE
jgi:hypothetical protein